MIYIIYSLEIKYSILDSEAINHLISDNLPKKVGFSDEPVKDFGNERSRKEKRENGRELYFCGIQPALGISI